MRVTCPNCQAQFRITVEILAIANGKVRCGRCKEVFDAAEQLGRKKKIPEEVIRIRSAQTEEQTSQQEEKREPLEHPEATSPEQQSRQVTEWFRLDPEKKEEAFNWFAKSPWPTSESKPLSADEEQPDANKDETTKPPAEDLTPVFEGVEKISEPEKIIQENEEDIPLVLIDDLNEQANPVRRHHFAWFLGVLIMGLLLSLQYAWFKRDELTQKPSLRPYLEIMCEYAKCRLPLMNDLKRGVHTVQIINSQIEPNPKDKKRLLAKIIILNSAKYAQEFPLIELRLTSFDEKIIAMRKFKPEEYLADKNTIKEGIQPGMPLNIILDIVKPSQAASGYHFELL